MGERRAGRAFVLRWRWPTDTGLGAKLAAGTTEVDVGIGLVASAEYDARPET
ncbi:MAG: hypothetical protein JWO77_3499 [Ilumatobacteraceae bacterium]|nr:hypothetical protein [Ilumatobacteraceae bacterium]